MINQRDKGKRGERELCKLLSEDLGIKVERNLSQTREGGCDTISIDGFSIEIKHQETLRLNDWWQQTLNQTKSGEQPILFYKQNHKGWKAQIRLSTINSDFEGTDYTCVIDYLTAVMLIREGL